MGELAVKMFLKTPDKDLKGCTPYIQRFTEIFSMIQVSEALSQYGPDAIIIIFIGICRWKRHGHWNLTFLILSYTM
jgi:hypothetical protein